MKKIPLTQSQLKAIMAQYGSTFHIYDEKAIRENARFLYKAFNWVQPQFKNYFAVKALPNPAILKILKEEGMGMDCSSLPELILSEKAGIKDTEVILTSNNTPLEEFTHAKEKNSIINLDDLTHLYFVEKYLGLPELLCFRYNPGPLKEGNALIGNPKEAKYGMTLEQLITGYQYAQQKGVTRFGLHTMVASNELNPDYFLETAKILFDAALEIHQRTGVKFEFINLGGGIGIPYDPDQNAVDLEYLSLGIKSLYEKVMAQGLPPFQVTMECGRMITGPYGYLVTKVRHRKEIYKTYIGVDACMADLMRPGVYGAYHHITVPGKEDGPFETVDVTGSLCENNDKFAIDRKIPVTERGDIVVIHDTGAHGSAMGFNYNGKLKHAELLLKENGEIELIRRAETIEDYFATLNI